jgi:hypothetical protein
MRQQEINSIFGIKVFTGVSVKGKKYSCVQKTHQICPCCSSTAHPAEGAARQNHLCENVSNPKI